MVLQLFRKSQMWKTHKLKDSYDVVIVGAGVHGLSTAYYLGKLGVQNIAVLEKSYIGGGGSARSTAIIRSNYLTTEGIPFFRESHKLYEKLAQELEYNLLFNQMGRLDIGHTESAVYWLQLRAEFNQLLGVDSRVIGPEEIKELVPPIDLRQDKPLPIQAALYHPPAGVVRHDAVVWGYARGADRLGAEIHPFTEVTGITRENGRVTGVDTSAGHVRANTVVSATAGWSSTISAMVGLDLPINTFPLQACVTEAVKPYIHTTISSADLHVYVYQTDRGELVIGGAVDPYSTYSQRSTLNMLEELAVNTLELLPELRNVKIMRQWTGLCDMTPDYAPIISRVDGIDGFILNCGWGTWGFKAAPISGKCTAEMIATGKTPSLIKAFGLDRFDNGRLINERAAAIAAAIH
jgi:sarcosine oxidase subunit beta